MKNSIYIFFLATALLTVSCEKAIDFRGEEQSPRVVVVSEPEPDTNLAVRLTYSRFFLSGSRFSVIGNADVKVVAGGVTYTGVFDDSVYVFPYSPVEGDSISLTVRMQNGGEDTVVTATTRMPHRPSVTVREAVGDNFRFVLNDRPGERNYYRMQVQSIDTTVICYDSEGNYVYDSDDPSVVSRDTVVDTTSQFFTCSDAVITSDATAVLNFEGQENYYVLIFNDEMFDGQNREITIKCEGNATMEYYKSSVRKSVSSRIFLYIEALSKEAYMYELSRYKQQEGDIFMTEPVQVQSNIDGGIGVFGAKATRVVELGTVGDR